MTRLLLPLAAVAALGGGVALWARFGGERAELVEREPNNTPGYANLLPLGAPLRGTIGKLNADGHGDVDYFRVPAGKGPRAVDARLEGIPNVDLVLEIYDSRGAPHRQERRARPWLGRVAAADHHRTRRGLPRGARGLDPGGEADGRGGRSLHADGPLGAAARRAGRCEPNDWPAAATPLRGAGPRARVSGARRRSGLVRDHRRPRRRVDRLGERAGGRRPGVDARPRREAAHRQARRRGDRGVRRRGPCPERRC